LTSSASTWAETPENMRPRVSGGKATGCCLRSPVGHRTAPRMRAAIVAAAFVAVIGALLLAPGEASAGARSHLTLTALEQSTVAQINSLRVAHGLDPLVVSPALFNAASTHCEQMIADGYFAHFSPGGRSFASRLEHYYPPPALFSYLLGRREPLLDADLRLRGRDRRTVDAEPPTPRQPAQAHLAPDRARGRYRPERPRRLQGPRRHGRHGRLRRTLVANSEPSLTASRSTSPSCGSG
jgi:hypothetical protein